MARRIGLSLLLVILASVLVGIIRDGYSVSWTGFGPSVNSLGEPVPAKTLWDWLDLLIVPLFLALAAWTLDGSRKASETRVETDRQRQKTLEDYLAAMTTLLVDGKLLNGASAAARRTARTRTLTALRSLDGGRKAQLLQFLYEAGLIGTQPVVSMNGADLREAQLDEAVLRNAELRGVYFERASFRRATLVDADFRGSDFSKADFTDANMKGTNLTQAILTGAKLPKGAI